MMSTLTDKKFLIGVAVGFFVVPIAARHARGLVDNLKAKANPQPAAA